MLKKLALVGMLCAVTACGGAQSVQVQAMQKKDKQLSCKEVLLEMNEAQFYQKTAQKNKDPNLKSVLMPLGYISTYMSAQDAIETASARVDYLDKIYGIMDCDAQKNNQAQVNYYPTPQQPMQQMQQPMPMQMQQRPQAAAAPAPQGYAAPNPQYIASSYDPRMQQQPYLAPAAPSYHYEDEQPLSQRMY